jgi:hypothetical protein
MFKNNIILSLLIKVIDIMFVLMIIWYLFGNPMNIWGKIITVIVVMYSYSVSGVRNTTINTEQ